MKPYTLFCLLASICLTAAAQDNVNTKFGKPTQQEMAMTTYAAEPNAEAVMLCRLTDVAYTIQTNGYLVDYHEKFRIKVLKPEGARFATVTIPYSKIQGGKSGINVSRFSLKAKVDPNSGAYFEGDAGSMTESAIGEYTDESVEDLKATAFNLVNGKIVKTRLKNSDVKKEQIDDENWQVKFTIPDVKEGTVIEYEYCVHSELFFRLRDWYAQCEIPVAYARLEMEIPTYLIFNLEEHGIQRLTCSCVTGSMRYKIESDPLAAPKPVSTNRYTCVGRDLKAMPKDEYVWNTGDYCAGVTAELKSFSLRGTTQMEYAKTWEQIDQMLLDDEDFGKQLDNQSPLREALEEAKVQDIADEQERAAAVCNLVLSRVKWNGNYELWPRKTSETLKKGEGTNADINMLLIQSLRDAGLTADPVVLRQRDNGQLPFNFPSFHKLTTYVVAVKGGETSKLSYIDASSAGGWLNALPEPLIVEKARIVSKKKPAQWVNLQKVSRSQITTVIDAVLDVDGKLTGKQTTNYKGLALLNYRRQAGKANEFAPEATEEITFIKQGEVSDGTISINPFNIAPIANNPFTADCRLLPVEFPSEMTHQISVNITLPEGYVLASEPVQTSVSTPDKGVSGRFTTAMTGGKAQVRYLFSVNKIVHFDNNYDTLRGMFDIFSKYSNEKLMFKKK